MTGSGDPEFSLPGPQGPPRAVDIDRQGTEHGRRGGCTEARAEPWVSAAGIEAVPPGQRGWPCVKRGQ